MANKPCILFFQIEPVKAKQIENICRTLKIQISKIKPASYSQKLGYLAGITGFNRENITYSGAKFPTEMLVFSGMDSDILDLFLEKYKEAGIPPIGLKAILTSQNIFWTAEMLYKELWQEHHSFQK